MPKNDNLPAASAPGDELFDITETGRRVPRMIEPLLRERQVVPGLPPAIDLTEAGERFLKSMAFHGASVLQTARCLGMSKDWLVKKLKEDSNLRTLWEQADALGEAELKAAGFEMAMVNPAQNQYERKVRMNENDKSDSEVTHKHYVVGMIPGSGPGGRMTEDEWEKNFKPRKEVGNDGDTEH